MRREKSQISKTRNVKGEITIHTKEIQGIRGNFESLIPINWKIWKKWTNF
jgi:hypothetical protein